MEATQAIVDTADEDGRLRGIIGALRSHRVQDDFSDRWSHAKEGFERKLYNKGAKCKVTFVELRDTIPVPPASEIDANLLWANVMALMNQRERNVPVLLHSGKTRLGNIAAELGYANHSAISKQFKKVRQKAARLFEH